MGFVIVLILVGLVLIFAEILLIPGVGVAGVLGLVSMGGSCFYAFNQMGTTTGIIVTVINAVLIVGLTVWVLRAKTWRKFTLNTNIDSKAIDMTGENLAIGDCGKTVTRLAPMGSACFGNYVVEVKALEGMLEPNIGVEVVLIEDNKIYVKPL
jgi:membrane-bound ClpP family serine protease